MCFEWLKSLQCNAIKIRSYTWCCSVSLFLTSVARTKKLIFSSKFYAKEMTLPGKLDRLTPNTKLGSSKTETRVHTTHLLSSHIDSIRLWHPSWPSISCNWDIWGLVLPLHKSLRRVLFKTGRKRNQLRRQLMRAAPYLLICIWVVILWPKRTNATLCF